MLVEQPEELKPFLVHGAWHGGASDRELCIAGSNRRPCARLGCPGSLIVDKAARWGAPRRRQAGSRRLDTPKAPCRSDTTRPRFPQRDDEPQMSANDQIFDADGDGGESKKERVNRELKELLEEVRVATPGAEVLSVFLLGVAFTCTLRRTVDVPTQRLLLGAGQHRRRHGALLVPTRYEVRCAGGPKVATGASPLGRLVEDRARR